jgi:hypothetical protein
MKTIGHSTRGSSAHEHVNRPRGGVIVESTLSSERQLLLGVSEYVRQGTPWSVSVETLSPDDSVHRTFVGLRR